MGFLGIGKRKSERSEGINQPCENERDVHDFVYDKAFFDEKIVCNEDT